ncbi:calcium-binding protein [Pararhizobium sp. A13]
MTLLDDGGWIVSWDAEKTGDSGIGSFIQRYNAAGQKTGGEVFVASVPFPSEEYSPTYAGSDVVGLSSGGWVVAWATENSAAGGTGNEVYLQQYSASGAAIGTAALVNTTTAGHQFDPEITSLTNGGWVVSWTSSAQDGDGYGVFYQQYDALGVKVGAESQVNSSSGGDQRDPAVTALSGGRWLATWTTYDPDTKKGGVNQQLFDAAGQKVGAETQVNTKSNGYFSDSSVTTLSNGGWVVTWHWTNSGHNEIYQKVYDASGTAISLSDISVGQTKGYGGASDPVVAALSSGGWVVAWNYFGVNDSDGIYIQVYDKSGKVIGTRQMVSADGDQVDTPAITALENDGFVVSWGNVGNGTLTIEQRQFSGKNAAPSGTNTVLSLKEDAKHVFVAKDFGFVDKDGDSLAGVVISAISSHGSLKLDGKLVSAGQVVKAADFAKLSWTPDANINGDSVTAFSFKVMDSGDTFHGGVNIDPTPNWVRFDIAPVVDNIKGTPSDNKLFGTSDDDILTGYAGNDLLNGKGGADQMFGGVGNDTYIVDNIKDIVNESDFGGGFDTINASVSYVAEWEIECLILTGSADIDGTSDGKFIFGNAGNNRLTGGYGALFGGAGNDILDGLDGRDVLTGGAGRDVFVRLYKDTTSDTITDFDAVGFDHDLLNLQGFKLTTSFATFKAKHVKQYGDDVHVENDHGKALFILENVSIADIGRSDFLF